MSESDREDQRIFICPVHQMVIVAWSDGQLSGRGSPGHRGTDCPSCDAAVDDAFTYAGIE